MPKLVVIMVLNLFETGFKVSAFSVLMIVSITLMRVKDGAGFLTVVYSPKVAGILALHSYKVRGCFKYRKVPAVNVIQLLLRKHILLLSCLVPKKVSGKRVGIPTMIGE